MNKLLSPNPSGLCMCGCGKRTELASATAKKHGHVKGQPLLFLKGHRLWRTDRIGPNPSALCMCGCGLSAPIATNTSARQNRIKGLPLKFIHGHNSQGEDGPSFKHGKSHTPEHNVWIGVIKRCFDPNAISYAYYGGSGCVTVSERWLGANGFTTFLKDVGKRPTPQHTLGRYGDVGNYELGNCNG